MYILQRRLVTLYSIVGIIAVFWVLVQLTGFLFGILTPHVITTWLATTANRIAASPATWWMTALIGWVLAIWTTSIIWKWRTQPAILIREDEAGAVEVTPEALCSLARAEMKARDVKGPCRAEFTRKLGSPMIQVWCDLTAAGGDGPVAVGEDLKTRIENRLIDDFGLNSVRVSVIHQPGARTIRRPGPEPAA